MSSFLENIKAAIIPILQNGGVMRASMFGSYARGDETGESDVDILVELPKGKSLLDLIDMEHKLKDRLGKNVDLVTYASVHPRLKTYIDQDQIPLL